MHAQTDRQTDRQTTVSQSLFSLVAGKTIQILSMYDLHQYTRVLKHLLPKRDGQWGFHCGTVRYREIDFKNVSLMWMFSDDVCMPPKTCHSTTV